MKIVLINSVCGLGSTGRICLEIAKRYSESGDEVRIAYGRGNIPDEAKKYAVKISTEASVRLNALKARLFDNEGFNAKKTTENFLKWLDEYDPDLIWLHNIHGYYLNIEMLFQWLKSHKEKKVRWTLHDCWSMTGHCAYFTYSKCEKWLTQCEKCPNKKDYPKSTFIDNCKKNYLRKKEIFTGVENLEIITPSEWLAQIVKKSFLKEYKVAVIRNEIDRRVFVHTESDFKKNHNIENKKVILGVANVWDRRKGFDDFIKLSKIINDSYVIVLVGLNKKQIKMLPKNIIGIKKTSNVKELVDIYNSASVFVNLSQEDNYPTTNLEAEACGVDVLTYDIGGCRETIKREDSMIIPENSVEKVIEILKWREQR